MYGAARGGGMAIAARNAFSGLTLACQFSRPR